MPVALGAPSVKKQMQLLTELTFIYILKLLGVEDEAKLAEIVSRLREGTPFYNFTVLAHNLAKSQTDFDFLTKPENLAAYAKITEVSRECGVVLFPYVNVLAKIAENKLYGLYSENQEVEFFLDEYDRYKNSVEPTEFLHQFKKILKYETQNLFERFIKDGIFSLIQTTLLENPEITSVQTLAIYVYCLHYYTNDISNADENFLHEHIRFCVNYLSKHNEIEFKPHTAAPFIPKFENEKEGLKYFFQNNSKMLDSLGRFCGFLKDICPVEDTYVFCDFLRENLYMNTGAFFDDKGSEFLTFLTDRIKEKAKKEKTQIYKDISLLLPLKIFAYNLVSKKQYEFENITLASAFTHVSEKTILKCIDSGNDFASWIFDEAMNKRNSEDVMITFTPLFANRKTQTFTSVKDAASYLGLKEYELKERLKNGDPYKGYKITLKS